MRRTSLIPAVALSLFLPVLALAKNEMRGATQAELAMTGVPFAPGASAAVLEWDLLHNDASQFDVEYMRIKIFTNEGKKYGDIEIPFVPYYSQVSNVEARTFKPDGTIVPFTAKTYDKLVIKSGGFKLMNKTFTLPDVQPGAVIEYRYRRTWPVVLPWGDSWILQREIPIMFAHITVKPVADGISSYFTHRGLPAGKKLEKVEDGFELRLQDIPAFEEEAFAPPEGELKPRLNLHYTIGKVDMDKYWTDFVKEATDEVEGFIGNRSGIRKAAAEIVAGADTDEAKLRKIYARVQSIRNLSFEQEKSEQEQRRENLKDNRHIEHVLNDGYGNRNELNRLFVGLARAAGFDASIVRVSQRDEEFFTKSLPYGHQLLSEIASVMNFSVPRYFDPGTPHAAFGELSWENTGVDGVKLKKKEAGEWIVTPVCDEAVTKRQATLELDGDALKGTVKLTFSGQEALVRRLAAHTHDDATNRKSIEDAAKGMLPEGSTVTLKNLSKIDGSDEDVVADFDVALNGVGAFTGSRALMPLSIFTTRATNPFAPATRKHGIYFSYPRRGEDEVTLRIPSGYAIEGLPKPATLDLGGAKFALEWKQDGTNVKLTRFFMVKTVSIAVDKYPALRTFYSRLGTADQESIVLKKDAK